MTDMSPCRLCAAPFPPVIVRIVDAPALPALPEFEDKWPNFLDSPLLSQSHPSRPSKKRYYYHLFPRQRVMPPTPPPTPRRLKPVSSDSTITAYDLHALSRISTTEHLFIATLPSDTSSLSDPSVHSPSDKDEDYETSAFLSWHNSYDFPATPSASPTELSPLHRCPSPSKVVPDLSMGPPPIPPRSSSRNSRRTSNPRRQPTPRPQAGPPLHFSGPQRAPPLEAPAYRHCATPPLPPPSPKFSSHATITPLHPSTYSTNTTPISSSLPNPSPLSRAVPLSASPVSPEKSVFDHEVEGAKGLKGVKARFHGRGASSGVNGARRKSAGEVVKGIFGGLYEKGGKSGKGGKGT